ncbi:MAG: thioredoxin-disulfide reductase [Deltaproteobacteria bacterium]|nr:thioredoxin-disulfide reductase [Candidatus Anaeroferrophillacea bacterium]
MSDCDLLILGGGPAGLTAGLYAARARLHAVLLERMMMGGQIATTETLENYPGFPEPLAGAELGPLFEKQAQQFGLDVRRFQEAAALERHESGFSVALADGSRITARALIAAMGTEWVKLGIPGEDNLRGVGVSYCATCDGAFFRDQEIAVIGGGNSAIEEALFLTKFARRVHVVHRRDTLRAERIVQERAFANDRIAFVWNHVPVAIRGESAVEGLEVRDVNRGETTVLPVTGVFIYIGMRANTALLQGLVAMDDRGFVAAGEDTVTTCPGLFAAGDIRQKPLRQVVTAVSDGAVAAVMAEKYLENLGDE